VADNIYRQMTRCTICKAWWSTSGELTSCPCGGDLEAVDMEKHIAGLPRKPYSLANDAPPPKKDDT
jgi:hypothetical protein